MTIIVAALTARRGEVDELITHVDEGLGIGPAPKRELEQVTIEFQRRVDIIDLQTNMINPNCPGLFGWRLGHTIISYEFTCPNAFRRSTPRLPGS
jgi:hypothetical protein